MTYLAVFVGGGLGSLTRWALSRWIGSSQAGFPIGTLTANFTACVVLGIITALVMRQTGSPRPIQIGIATGFCGGFSTFSTFSQEAFALFASDRSGIALLYIGLSLALCLLGIGLGYFLMNWKNI